jgi:hypothetical protein
MPRHINTMTGTLSVRIASLRNSVLEIKCTVVTTKFLLTSFELPVRGPSDISHQPPFCGSFDATLIRANVIHKQHQAEVTGTSSLHPCVCMTQSCRKRHEGSRKCCLIPHGLRIQRSSVLDQAPHVLQNLLPVHLHKLRHGITLILVKHGFAERRLAS